MTPGRRIRVRGQVQGVGFRPFVWQLAHQMGIAGEVLNDPEGVLIFAVGEDLDRFEAKLLREGPPLARVDAVESTAHVFSVLPNHFRIAASRGQGTETWITPDVATCPACVEEIRNPAKRRFGYAFTNCTHCGPRFTIVRSLPYDRPRTAMAPFAMCPACRAEYEDPTDRRFHAQPIACPACGPRLWLEVGGTEITGDAIALAAARLRQGEILAIKGLGGFHLACDAQSGAAIDQLRVRKQRPRKPLALMGTLAMIRSYAEIGDAEAARLADPAASILLLRRAGQTLPDAVAPGQGWLGWMLPYTPLHHLLLDAFGGPLVMTSGNLSGEPQVIDNDTARIKLSGFADAFLMHDRDILRRLDDGVERLLPSGPMILRRSRGRAPETLALPPEFADAPPVLAVGGQMKGALCLIKGGRALLSHHLGDLDEPLTWGEFLRAEADYTAVFDHHPRALACDQHPGYRLTQYAHGRSAAEGLPLVEVQHHHAHLAAAMADAGWPRNGGKVAGIVLDGLGLGTDGTIWGGEVLLGDYFTVERIAHLTPAALPGGDAANREPWRNLLARLDAAGVAAERLLPGKPVALLRQAMRAGVNTPLSSSAGRLFDAVAAALGLIEGAQGFEGEAGMAVEALAGELEAAPYAFGTDGPRIDPAPMIHTLVVDLAKGRDRAEVAAAFQAGLARAFCIRARALVESSQAQAVALSGGCFQNARLLALCLRDLDGLRVLVHNRVPPNDGGLALGQALVAAARLAKEGQT